MALLCRWFIRRQYPGLPRGVVGGASSEARALCPGGTQEPAHPPSLRRVLSFWARTAPPAGTGLGCRVPTLGARWPAARLHPHKSRALGWGCCSGFSPNSPVPGGHHGSQQADTPEPMQSRLQKVSVTPALMFGAGGGRGRAGGRPGKQAPPSSGSREARHWPCPVGSPKGQEQGSLVPERPGPCGRDRSPCGHLQR